MIKLKEAAYYVSDKIDVSKLTRNQYITTDNMLPNRGGVTDCENLPQAARVTKYECGDILVSNIRPYFKKIWYANKVGGCSNDVIVFRANNDSLNSKFLYYVLSQNSFFDFVMSGANGTKMPRGNKDLILDFLVPNFNTKKQKSIADILSAYDDLIENNQKQIKLLEEAAQRLYKEWFVDFRFPGYENAKFIDDIPEGWRKDVIDSKIEILSGYAFKSNDFNSDGKFKIVTIKNVKDGEFDGENVNCIIDIPTKMPSHCKLYDKDILLSLTGNVGRVCMINGDGYLLNQRVAKLKSDIHSYTYCLFRSKYMFDKMNNLANGAAQQNLSPIKTGKIKVIFPTNELLSKFEVLVEPIISKINITNRNIIKLTQARDRLLPKLMSGEIEV